MPKKLFLPLKADNGTRYPPQQFFVIGLRLPEAPGTKEFVNQTRS